MGPELSTDRSSRGRTNETISTASPQFPVEGRSTMLSFKGPATVTRLLPVALVGLTALITTVMIEAIYFACHLWQWIFDGAALSFSWIEPLPAAGLATTIVLIVGL